MLSDSIGDYKFRAFLKCRKGVCSAARIVEISAHAWSMSDQQHADHDRVRDTFEAAVALRTLSHLFSHG
jgi:hypothetical protein